MEYSKKDQEKPIYYKINKWSVIAIIGLFVVIAGIISIILSRFIYRGVIDDYIILIYIVSDYFYMKAGFSFEKCFILFCTAAYNNYQMAISTLLLIGIILCVIGQGITLFGFIQDYRISRQYNNL
ncbi:MAG: hypothetical protein HWN67_23545 [Candidatus Helarchaeota archaeon]|nr:hypothetical protein [Candidatus Helarchaeota archaeon]